jgi:dihydrolipoamide dehydrogenase
VTVTLTAGGEQTLTADRIIIATGCCPIVLPVPGADSPDILKVDDLLNMEKLPESIVVIGGGVVGVEMATFMAKLGSQVSIVEMMPQCLPAQDCEIAAVLEKALETDGIKVYSNTKLVKISDGAGGKKIVTTDSTTQPEIEAGAVVIAVGYKPNTADMGFEENGLDLNRSAIVVNEKMETNLPGIYAIGDAVGGVMLAHVAMAEGLVAAENALGGIKSMNYDIVPSCIFSLPEVGCIGLSEAKAQEAGYEINVGHFPFMANGMAKIMGEMTGIVKIIADKKYGQILGAHIIGPQATNLIAEISAAMKLEATVDDIVGLIHSHPSLSEAIWEAAADITGTAIHSLSRRRA